MGKMIECKDIEDGTYIFDIDDIVYIEQKVFEGDAELALFKRGGMLHSPVSDYDDYKMLTIGNKEYQRIRKVLKNIGRLI